MKITATDIKNYELAARKYLADYGVEGKDISLDHFGLQTLSKDEYKDLKNYFIERGKFDGEIVHHNRKLGKFRLGQGLDDTMELIEPHPGEVFWQIDCYVEHIAFRVKDLARYSKVFSDRMLSSFSIEESRGFKIQGPSQLLIEIRSNKF
jgi:hypothetical protein